MRARQATYWQQQKGRPRGRAAFNAERKLGGGPAGEEAAGEGVDMERRHSALNSPVEKGFRARSDRAAENAQ
jgi:hypothetical protein